MATHIRTWFYRFGRLETASFVALLGVGMPLKYAAGIAEPNRWIGWAHGLLLIVYLIALLGVARAYKVSFGQIVVAGLLALLPFGPVVLEHRWRKRGVLGEDSG